MNERIAIPQANPLLGYQVHRPEIDTAIARVLNGGRYVLGDEVRAFEAEFAAYIGVSFGVGVASGTDALRLALAVCGVGPGDEVITVSHTAVATVAAIVDSGARAVFVDVDPVTLTLDPAKIEDAITARTRAIVPVHLYGHPADLDPILACARKNGLRVVEDCAQSHGALYKGQRTGSFGDCGCFSFYPTKNLGAMGDGGLVVADDSLLAERLRLLRQYGWRERYVSEVHGTNSRLDEVQAAILRVKLRYLDDENDTRRKLAGQYDRLLRDCRIERPNASSWAAPVFHQYVVRSTERDALGEFLAGRGIGTLVHYPVPVHLQPAYRQANDRVSLPETERAAKEVLSLPMYPQLGHDEVARVAAAVREWNGMR